MAIVSRVSSRYSYVDKSKEFAIVENQIYYFKKPMLLMPNPLHLKKSINIVIIDIGSIRFSVFTRSPTGDEYWVVTRR